MKQAISNTWLMSHHGRPFWIVWLILLLTSIVMAPSALSSYEQEGLESRISIDVKNEDLSEVLKKVADISGRSFILDEKWSSISVTTSFENQPLERALQRILKNVDHLIVYNTNNEVKVLINKQKVLSSPTTIIGSEQQQINTLERPADYNAAANELTQPWDEVSNYQVPGPDHVLPEDEALPPDGPVESMDLISETELLQQEDSSFSRQVVDLKQHLPVPEQLPPDLVTEDLRLDETEIVEQE